MRTVISLFVCAADASTLSAVADENPIEFSDFDPTEITGTASGIWLDEDVENDLTELIAELEEDQILSLNEEQVAVLFSDFERTVDESQTDKYIMGQWDRLRDQVESDFDSNPDEWLSKNLLFIHKLRA